MQHASDQAGRHGSPYCFNNRRTLYLAMAAAGWSAALTSHAVAEPAPATTPAAAIEQVQVTGYPHRISTGSGDSARLLQQHGVQFFSGGGVASLPVIRGLNDDRVKVRIDGVESTSACANHMNPALSYLDASRVTEIEVVAGLTPVSLGGDSIAGTINLTSEQPLYTAEGELKTGGSLSWLYRGNNRNHSVAANLHHASDRASLSYSGSYDKAESYRDGNGDKVLDTLYRSENHNLTLGLKGEQQSLLIKLNHQQIPYQGFVNQYMDMTGNTSNGINIQHLRTFAWGTLSSRVFWQEVEHEMGFFTQEKAGTMPMKTEGRDLGYRLQAELPLNEAHKLRIGHEFHRFTLDDWWPAVPGHMGMGPQDYININDGERSRYAVYIESEYQLNEHWQTLAGIRYERVVSDTGRVQPYNTMPMSMMGPNLDAPAAAAFNQRDRQREDDNIDVTLVARHHVNDRLQVDFGYARKSRSPNLYERYSWGRNSMAMSMVGWYGDGNGYVGDVNLDPEVAHTLSATFQWRSAQPEQWSLSLSPYYTYVDDYIDADVIGSFNPRMSMAVSRPQLQFTNLDAELYGLELRGLWQLADSSTLGQWRLRGSSIYTRGQRHDEDRDSGYNRDLYQIMPLQLTVALEHQFNNWRSQLEVEWTDNKSHTDERRLENTTGSHTLLNLETRYQWQRVSVNFAVRNLLDEQYELPLGGVYLAGWINSDHSDPFQAVPGQGRSMDIGVTYRF